MIVRWFFIFILGDATSDATVKVGPTSFRTKYECSIFTFAGFSSAAAAHFFVKLMKRLGFDKFYIQGGDWGAIIVTTMAAAYPQ